VTHQAVHGAVEKPFYDELVEPGSDDRDFHVIGDYFSFYYFHDDFLL
jgi:hypothetical protein